MKPISLEPAQRVREEDDRFHPAKGGVAELGVALHQRVPDGGGTGVDLFADAVAAVALRPPGVAMAANVAREALRLDGHHTAGANQHVVDVTSSRAERDVVDETVVVRQST